MGRFNLPLFFIVVLLAGIIAIPLRIYTSLTIWVIIALAPIISFITLFLFSIVVDFCDADRQKTPGPSIHPSKDWIDPPKVRHGETPLDLFCPKCSSDQIMKIIYGLPPITKALQKKLDNHTVTLGGCMIGEESPRWACAMCHCRFQSPPISRKQAAQMIHHIIKEVDAIERDDDELIIIESETIEKEWGWVFFYSSKKWVETNDFQYAVAGNAPYIVLRHSGKILETGTAYPIDHYITRFEETGDPHG